MPSLHVYFKHSLLSKLYSLTSNFKSHKMTYIATMLRSLRPISCPFSPCPGCFKHVKTSDCHLYLINPAVSYELILKLFSVQQSRRWFHLSGGLEAANSSCSRGQDQAARLATREALANRGWAHLHQTEGGPISIC